jgi:hypothetical protein
MVAAQMKSVGASVALGLTARQAAGSLGVDMVVVTPKANEASTRTYGGHPKNIPAWGANSALEMLRREIAGR